MLAETLDVAFHGSGAVESPAVLGDGDGEVAFVSADGGDLDPRLVLKGSVALNNKDISHYFDPTKLGLPGNYPSADGTGVRNYIERPASFANDMTLTKAIKADEGDQG